MVAWVSRSSLVKTDSTSPPLSLQAFQRSSSQASSPAGESLSPWARVAPSSMCTARCDAERRSRSMMRPRIFGGLVVGEWSFFWARSSTRGPVKKSSGSPERDMNAVQLVGVLVAQLAGDERADVAAPGGVLVVAQDLGHQGVPQVGDLPEVDVRKAGERAGESKAGQGRHDHVERIGRVAAVEAAGSASGSITFDQCQNVHGQP